MASTFAVETSSAMEKSRNWLEMPEEVMASILQRLGAVEILNNARKVCTTWRRICKNPRMWKVIDMHKSFDPWVTWYAFNELETLTKQAVDLSCGELIDISIDDFGTDDLLDYIVLRSSKLKSLWLRNCYDIMGSRLIEAVKRVPQLEKLYLSHISIEVEDIKVIGQNCPHLKSFMMAKDFVLSLSGNDEDALAIANNMPGLRHLQVFGNEMTNDGLKAILDGCPHLESLDVRRCFNLELRGDLGNLCVERIKYFKRPNDLTEKNEFRPRFHEYDEFYVDSTTSEADVRDYADDHFIWGMAEDYVDEYGHWVSD